MRKVRVTCAQPVVGVRGNLSTTTPTLPHVEFTNANLGTNHVVLPTESTNFPTTFSQLFLANNGSETTITHTFHRTNNKDNKGE
jgi:hypothetical protein